MNKRGKILNKKNVDRAFSVMMVFAGILIIEYIIMYMNINIGTIGNLIYLITTILFIVGMLVAIILQVAYLFKAAFSHVSRYKGKQCFEKIEFFYKNLGECNGYYQSIIREINKVYNENSEINVMVEKGDLDSLYARKSYLENNMDFHSNIIQVITSCGISGIFALINFKTGHSFLVPILLLVAATVGVVLCGIAKYVEKGRGGSYLYNVYEYELQLLNDKIISAYNNLQANKEIERVIHMRQVVIHTLSDLYTSWTRRRQTGLKKKMLVSMVQEMYELPLVEDINRDNIVWEKKRIHNIDCDFPVIIVDKQCKCLSENYERVEEIINAVLHDRKYS